jgi:hypothetical protein
MKKRSNEPTWPQRSRSWGKAPPRLRRRGHKQRKPTVGKSRIEVNITSHGEGETGVAGREHQDQLNHGLEQVAAVGSTNCRPQPVDGHEEEDQVEAAAMPTRNPVGMPAPAPTAKVAGASTYSA